MTLPQGVMAIRVPWDQKKMGKSLDQQPGSTEWSHSYRMGARRPRLRAGDGILRERDKAPARAFPDGLPVTATGPFRITSALAWEDLSWEWSVHILLVKNKIK